MMPPAAFTAARMAARDHVQARVLRWTGALDVRVIRVFRGVVRPGVRLTLTVHASPDGPTPFDSILYVDWEVVARARYVEAFLDGDPPDVIWDQIKFLRRRPWRRQGDPAIERFIW